MDKTLEQPNCMATLVRFHRWSIWIKMWNQDNYAVKRHKIARNITKNDHLETVVDTKVKYSKIVNAYRYALVNAYTVGMRS